MNIVPIPTQPQDEVTVSWETFYLLYPRHEARKDGLKAWNQFDACRSATGDCGDCGMA